MPPDESPQAVVVENGPATAAAQANAQAAAVASAAAIENATEVAAAAQRAAANETADNLARTNAALASFGETQTWLREQASQSSARYQETQTAVQAIAAEQAQTRTMLQSLTELVAGLKVSTPPASTSPEVVQPQIPETPQKSADAPSEAKTKRRGRVLI